MSMDKLVDSTQLDADLTSVANAIRTKGGTSASLAFPADFVSAIAAIPTGGGGDYEIVGGTVTLASEASSVSVETGFDPEFAYISISPYDTDPSLLPTSWRTGSMVLDRVHKFGINLNVRNLNGSVNVGGGGLNNSRLGSYSNGYYTFDRSNNTANYLSDIVYYWFAWRAKT